MRARRRITPNRPQDTRPFRWLRPAVITSAGLLLVALPVAAQLERAGDQAAVLTISGQINDITAQSLARRVAEARSAGAQTLIFKLDTPGGLVTSSIDVSRMIKGLPDDIRTVAWVHPDAYSGGAMIAVACREIVMSRASAVGDCAPIMAVPVKLDAAERAKLESPVLQEFRDSAAVNGYDPLLCRAMVTVGEEVWWIENAETGDRRFVTTADKERLVGPAAAASQPSAVEPAADAEKGSSDRSWRLVQTMHDPVSDREVAVEQPIDRSDALLTLSQSEAVAFGIAKGIASDFPELKSLLNLTGTPIELDISGWEAFVVWLNSPLVRGVLFVIVLIGGYLEFHSPGLILPGVTAAIALVIFLGAPYAVGLADIWTIVLFVLGLVLLGVEIFLIPGFGVAGILGIVLILGSILGSFVPEEPGTPWFSLPSMAGTWDALKRGIIVLASSLIIAAVGIVMLMRYLPELPVARRLILTATGAGQTALTDLYPNVALPGDIGVVVGTLRPGGQVRFGSEVVDVQSQGEYVDSGRRVQVIKREGNQVIVRPLPQNA